jgi:hypothetical protein
MYEERDVILVTIICMILLVAQQDIIIINVPLMWKVREIIFFVGKIHNRIVQGIFRGGRDLFDPYGCGSIYVQTVTPETLNRYTSKYPELTIFFTHIYGS